MDNKLARLYLLKEHLNIRDDSAELVLRYYLQSAEDYVRDYCNRQFSYGEYKHLVPLNPLLVDIHYVSVYPKETPIESIINVEVWGEDTTDYTLIDNVVYVDISNQWTYRPRYILVDYVGGYHAPDSTDTPRVPTDLEQAVIYIASIMYNERILGIGRQNINTESGSFSLDFQKLPFYIKNILEHYRYVSF